MNKEAKETFPFISQKKCKAAIAYLSSQTKIKKVSVTTKPFLEIVADSDQVLDPVDAREMMTNAIRNIGFNPDFTTQPQDGDNVSYRNQRKIYLANAVFAHGDHNDPGIGVSITWERKLSPNEYRRMTA